MYAVGDPVIYRLDKVSPRPGPRAIGVDPAPKGEFYSYQVDKFWVVAEIRDDGKLLLKTRRGKQHVVDRHDRRLRRPRWWERLLYRHRFPRLPTPDAPQSA